MLKLILLVGLAAFALFWIAAPPTSSGPESQSLPSSSGGDLVDSSAATSVKIRAIAKRREIFCGMVSQVKSELDASATERERNLFDLAPNGRRWEVLRSYMVERGSPDGGSLLSALAVGSIDDIEFGTLDGSVGCSIPDEAGFVIRQPSR